MYLGKRVRSVSRGSRRSSERCVQPRRAVSLRLADHNDSQTHDQRVNNDTLRQAHLLTSLALVGKKPPKNAALCCSLLRERRTNAAYERYAELFLLAPEDLVVSNCIKMGFFVEPLKHIYTA